MKIIRLEAENVKRLRAVEIEPEPGGGLVVIRGENGQGKSSVLDAIAYALGGTRVQPPKVIRDGETEAHAVIETDDGLIIERRWTPGGQRLEVRSKDGAKYPAPQKHVDDLVGRLSFDPLAFMRLDPKAQAEAVRKLVGLDFSELDAKRAGLFEMRTEINRRAQTTRSQAQGLPDQPAAPVDVAQLLAKMNDLQLQREDDLQLQNKHAEIIREGKLAASHIEAVQKRIAELEASLAEWRKQLTEATAKRDTLRRNLRDVESEIEMRPPIAPELERVRAELQSAEGVNVRARDYARRQALEKDAAELETEAAAWGEKIKAIDEEKTAALAAAKFPVPGMAFTGEGVTLNGLPLEQASSAEQLRVSVGMGLALNPKLRVLLIRDGSLLDGNSLQLVAGMAKAADAQVWIEIVGKNGGGVIIEDGAVAGAEPPPEAEQQPKKRSRKAAAP